MSRTPAKIFISSGEPSGDIYASALVDVLRPQWPEAEWFGCTGPRMRAAGVRTVLDQETLSVVGLVEVLAHLPAIYRAYRGLVRTIAQERPDLVILTDSPDFHLRVAAKVHAMGIPVVYLVAPQAWAWRSGRTRQMRRNIQRLLCLFPFEEKWYRERGVNAHYIGHPLARLIRPTLSRDQFFAKNGLHPDRPLVALCPGSRRGEVGRHLPTVAEAAARINEEIPSNLVLACPAGFSDRAGAAFFRQRISLASIKVIEGETWNVLAHADVALAASGTVTMEAALLGAPLVTYYKVTGVSWMLGRLLVRVPYYSMVNLIAGRRLAVELMQNEFTAPRLAEEALSLLRSDAKRETLRVALRQEVAARLASEQDPMQRAARIVRELYEGQQD